MFTDKKQVKDMIKRSHNYLNIDRLTLNGLIEHVEQQYNYNMKKDYYNVIAYSSKEPVEKYLKYESEHKLITVTFIEDEMNGLVPHIKNNFVTTTEEFTSERFMIEDERHMYLYDDTTFQSGELIYRYTDGIQHTNTLDVSLDCLIDDIFQHVHPERLQVYYKYDNQKLMLFNGKQLQLMQGIKKNNCIENTNKTRIRYDIDDVYDTLENDIELKSNNTKLLETFTWCTITLTIVYFIFLLLLVFFI